MTKEIKKILLTTLTVFVLLPSILYAYMEFPPVPPAQPNTHWDPNQEQYVNTLPPATPLEHQNPYNTDSSDNTASSSNNESDVAGNSFGVYGPNENDVDNIIDNAVNKIANSDQSYLTIFSAASKELYDLYYPFYLKIKSDYDACINSGLNSGAGFDLTPCQVQDDKDASQLSDEDQAARQRLSAALDAAWKAKYNSQSNSSSQSSASKTKITPGPESENDKIAKDLNLPKVTVIQDGGGVGQVKIYSSGSLPDLKPNEVLVRGHSDKIFTTDNGVTTVKNQDTYYIADKNSLPDGYVLSGIEDGTGEIYSGSVTSENRGGVEVPIRMNDDNSFTTLYNIMTKDEALAHDARYDKAGVFTVNYDNRVPEAKNPLFRAISFVSAAVGQDAVLNHFEQRIYSEDSGTTLSKFVDYSHSLPENYSKQQSEESIYNYVNNNIKSEDPSVPGSLSHNLEQAVVSGRGVCRDKAVALETGLNARGIPASRVTSDNHVFVAVLNPDGSANHYLDPMYYETYLPLQRPNVKPSQIMNQHPIPDHTIVPVTPNTPTRNIPAGIY